MARVLLAMTVFVSYSIFFCAAGRRPYHKYCARIPAAEKVYQAKCVADSSFASKEELLDPALVKPTLAALVAMTRLRSPYCPMEVSLIRGDPPKSTPTSG